MSTERSYDVQWMCAAFDEAAVDFETIALLTPHVLQTENFRGLVGEEIAFVVNAHLELEVKYRGAYRASRAKVQPGAVWAPDDDLFDIAQSLCDSIRSICRKIRAAPHLLKTLKRNEATAETPWFMVLSQVAEFFSITKRKLLALAEDEYVNQEAQLEDIARTLTEASLKEKELQLANKAQKAERALHQAQTTTTIEALKAEMAKITATLNERRAKTESETVTALREIQFERERNGRRQEQLEKIEAQTGKLRVDGLDKETRSRKEVRRLTHETAECIAAYDEKMIELTGQYDALLVEYDRDAAVLKDVREAMEALIEEREEYEAVLAEQERIRQENERRLNAAAVMIQKIWRGYSTRMALKRNAKGASGKKGKGKAKKK
ncbi:Dynein regulatory complex protein 10 [Plasmodiophora brassicae]|uniref:Dynein regulatory complex protein 10 n=1 Tax=Plasmodiophora brassicae TaxID=37360 RepID=A0A0G4J1D8_PLABS|nr:hypothetical protein PBRA_002064 [Plasmodiophora brassicae]SPQ93259.1 unnamed protein product [Plasmodiophora brassicae]